MPHLNDWFQVALIKSHSSEYKLRFSKKNASSTIARVSSCGNFQLWKPRIGTHVGYFGTAVLGFWDTGSEVVEATISESPPLETISKLPV
mmetsp:Transcript_7323/g.11658  ORF Transcript_7323/g.11658 Transcript_7323/m.11658 type:complete len:90 (-) Transcript_7323:325-594(-)